MSERVWTKPGPLTVLCGACGAEGVVQIRDGETWLSWGPSDVPEETSLVEQLGRALEKAEPILARLDTLRHLVPDYPELDKARAALAAWRAQKGGTPK